MASRRDNRLSMYASTNSIRRTGSSLSGLPSCVVFLANASSAAVSWSTSGGGKSSVGLSSAAERVSRQPSLSSPSMALRGTQTSANSAWWDVPSARLRGVRTLTPKSEAATTSAIIALSSCSDPARVHRCEGSGPSPEKAASPFRMKPSPSGRALTPSDAASGSACGSSVMRHTTAPPAASDGSSSRRSPSEPPSCSARRSCAPVSSNTASSPRLSSSSMTTTAWSGVIPAPPSSVGSDGASQPSPPSASRSRRSCAQDGFAGVSWASSQADTSARKRSCSSV